MRTRRFAKWLSPLLVMGLLMTLMAGFGAAADEQMLLVSGPGSAATYETIESDTMPDWADWVALGTAVAPSANPWGDLIPGAAWISNSTDPDPAAETARWRRFTVTFDLPCNAVNAAATIEFSGDNEVYLFQGETELFGAANAGYDDWRAVKSVAFTPVPGTNTLEFLVKNWAWNAENPTALIYSAVVDYDLAEGATAVEFMGPIVHANFAMREGSTIPVKFAVTGGCSESTMEPQENIHLTISGADEFLLDIPQGTGTDALRYDEMDYTYVANLRDLPAGQYTLGVYAGEQLLGSMDFAVLADPGVNRGNGQMGEPKGEPNYGKSPEMKANGGNSAGKGNYRLIP